jgi:hypothetical protein
LTFRVRLEDTDPARGLLGLTPTSRLTGPEVAHWHRCLTDAWRILAGRHRAAAETLAAVLTCIVPVEPDQLARGISATSADAFGAAAMSAPEDGVSLAVGLLHEAQHSILNAATYLFDLLFRPDEVGYSPWRDDPRPQSGILHGAYAYLAVTRFRREEGNGGEAAKADKEMINQARGLEVSGVGREGNGAGTEGNRAATEGTLAAFEFARWREAVASVAADLLDKGDLTPAGRRFVGALMDEVTPWLAEPVKVTQLARAANRDHHLRWRLINLTVSEPATDALARAWREGRPSPQVTADLRPGTGRKLEASTRLQLIHASLRGDPPPHPGARATAGDSAFLRGDYGTARCAYVESVWQNPADDAAWTGLALVTGGGDRLELTKAVTIRVRADPVAVDRWICRQ